MAEEQITQEQKQETQETTPVPKGRIRRRKKVKRRVTDINKKLFHLIILNFFLIASGLLWLDYLGLLSLNNDVFPAIAKIPGLNFLLPKRTEDPYLLAKEEQKKLDYSRQIAWMKLKEKEKELKNFELKLKEKENALNEQWRRLKEKEKQLDLKYKEKETYKQKVEQQAVYLVSMPPQQAVQRLQNMDDLLVIDIFKAIEKKAKEEGKQSIVPYYLSLMDSKRAAAIQRKMTIVEEDISGESATNQ